MLYWNFDVVVHAATAFVGPTPIVWIGCKIKNHFTRLAKRRLGRDTKSSHVAINSQTTEIVRVVSIDLDQVKLQSFTAATFGNEKGRKGIVHMKPIINVLPAKTVWAAGHIAVRRGTFPWPIVAFPRMRKHFPDRWVLNRSIHFKVTNRRVWMMFGRRQRYGQTIGGRWIPSVIVIQ